MPLNRGLSALVIALLGSPLPGEVQVLAVARPGPVWTGVQIPSGVGSLKLQGPKGQELPLQWRWQRFGAPMAGRRWAVLCFEASRPGLHRLHCEPGIGPARLEMDRPELPVLLLQGVPLAPSEPSSTWVGPVCAVRTGSGFGGPGEGLWWWLQVESWACGEVRLSLEVSWLRNDNSGPLDLTLELPAGPESWQVVRGGGQVLDGLWRPFARETSLAPGEAWLSRIRGSLGHGVQRSFRWGDQPRRPGRRASFDRLPAGPHALPVFGAGSLSGPDRALDQALRQVVAKITGQQEPRNRGDLQDRHGAWLNLEYDLAWALVLHFQRTGDPLFLEAALEASDHVTTTDRACLDRTGEIRALPHVHGNGHRGRGTESGHVWLQGQLGAALLAGDERLVARAAETVFALVGVIQDRGGRRISRTLGWPALALAAWEEWTGAEQVTRAYQALAEQVARAWSDEEGAFLFAGEKLGPGLWLVPPWVQVGLLTRPALHAKPSLPWGARLSRLLRPPLASGCTESLIVRAGDLPRPGRPASLAHLALALEGGALAACAEEAWQREARGLARGMEKALQKADGRELTLLARAWPVVALGLMGPRDQRNVRVPR